MQRFKTVLCIVITSLWLATPAHADDDDWFNGQPRGFGNQLNSIVEIQNKGQDKDRVVLQGRLTNYLGKDNYEFTDLKGDRIEVELDDDVDWSQVHRNQLISIMGKVDKNMFTVKVEAKQYRILPENNAPASVAQPQTRQGQATYMNYSPANSPRVDADDDLDGFEGDFDDDFDDDDDFDEIYQPSERYKPNSQALVPANVATNAASPALANTLPAGNTSNVANEASQTNVAPNVTPNSGASNANVRPNANATLDNATLGNASLDNTTTETRAQTQAIEPVSKTVRAEANIPVTTSANVELNNVDPNTKVTTTAQNVTASAAFAVALPANEANTEIMATEATAQSTTSVRSLSYGMANQQVRAERLLERTPANMSLMPASYRATSTPNSDSLPQVIDDTILDIHNHLQELSSH